MRKSTTNRKKYSKPEDDAVITGSSNLFADLDFPDANLHLEKVKLALKISDLVKGRNLLQKETATLLTIDQPKVSRLLRGLVREFSLEKLMEFANKLGSPHEVSEKNKRLSVSVTVAPLQMKDFPIAESWQLFDARSISTVFRQRESYRQSGDVSSLNQLTRLLILHSSPAVQSIY